jgi:hypothetical protein
MFSRPGTVAFDNSSREDLTGDCTVSSGRVELPIVPNAFFIGCLGALLVDALLRVIVAPIR